MKRRTEITIEIERVLVFGKRGSQELWCETCGAEASLITVSEAAAIADTSVRAIYQRAESGVLHSSITHAGPLLICLTSLLRDGHSFHRALRGTSRKELRNEDFGLRNEER
jgi:hypothetical protein